MWEQQERLYPLETMTQNSPNFDCRFHIRNSVLFLWCSPGNGNFEAFAGALSFSHFRIRISRL